MRDEHAIPFKGLEARERVGGRRKNRCEGRVAAKDTPEVVLRGRETRNNFPLDRVRL
jgi:hypothetical protein